MRSGPTPVLLQIPWMDASTPWQAASVSAAPVASRRRCYAYFFLFRLPPAEGAVQQQDEGPGRWPVPLARSQSDTRAADAAPVEGVFLASLPAANGPSPSSSLSRAPEKQRPCARNRPQPLGSAPVPLPPRPHHDAPMQGTRPLARSAESLGPAYRQARTPSRPKQARLPGTQTCCLLAGLTQGGGPQEEVSIRTGRGCFGG